MAIIETEGYNKIVNKETYTLEYGNQKIKHLTKEDLWDISCAITYNNKWLYL